MTIYKAFIERINGRTMLLAFVPLVLIIIAEIATTSLIPYTRKIVIDSLVDLDWNWFLWSAGIAFTNSLILIGAQGMKEWVAQKIAFLGREALMKTIKKTWINKGGHTAVTNPCARLNDDARLATELALKVFVEIFISAIIVISLLFTIFKWPMLFWTAIVYSGISISLAVLFRKPMINRKYILSDAEGRHRVALTKISIQQGDYTSKVRWEELRVAYFKYIALCRNYKLFHAVQTAAMYSIPFFIMAPDLFAGKITLGDITQGTLTFDLLVLNATIWVTLFPGITEAQTAFIRLKEMYKDVHNE